VAAVQADRRYVGFDMEEAYIDLAERRIATARKAMNEA
jgi:DNA modification methylase